MSELGRPATSIQVRPGVPRWKRHSSTSTLCSDLDVLLRVLDQGEVERLVRHGRAAGERARRGAGLGMAVE